MNILLVAPYPDLASTAQECLESYPYDVNIIHGDLDAGLKAAENCIRENKADMIISRGGTATLLQKNLSVPTFEIDVTGYDLLRAIYPHAKRNKKIAVIGYENVISGARSIASILSIDLGYFLITTQQNIEQVVKDAKQWGAEVVTGDTVSVETAKEMGMRYELIKSGPEAVIDTVEAAVNFIGHMHTEMVRNKRLNVIMEHSQQAIFYLTAQQTIEMVNTKALKIFGKTNEQLVGRTIQSSFLPKDFVDAVLDQRTNHLLSISGKDYMLEVLRIFAGENNSATLVFLQSSGRIKDLEDKLRKQMIKRGLIATHSFDEMTAVNADFIKTIEKARRYSKTNSTILLLGETGSGKEMFAQSIHNSSLRKDGPFVAVNCAALPDSLLESELFGYAEGAFTGAKKGGKAGLFEMAHKGTIFLDEVNDMSKSVQARFLRVLQEKQVMRIGDDRIHSVDVRFIAACNKDLYEETETGNFRKDLYYRLRVLDIIIPPLRKRKDDILPLFNSFMQFFAGKYGYSSQYVPSSLKETIETAHWPGNIRQLRNFAEKVSVLFSMNMDIHDMEQDLISELNNNHPIPKANPNPLLKTDRSLKEIEAEIVKTCCEQYEGNISKTARQLGIDRATVRKFLQTS
ncbi:MAG: sigma 54-interacting transcriptional regulator [Spirochaetia bacterium]|nr:sigma 54-interacting transcriptional regulator [Spirochaetia bacterium]MCF7945510.1 sigma 54-interacting transcriptional regulator [Spirochaetia bacterium]MCF7946813.1 sigma 54-interacting transcriptional regulator [Spirochaetia bacterium]